MTRKVALLLALAILAGCACVLPLPTAARAVPTAGLTLYFPMTMRTLDKLGMAGCPSAAGMARLGGGWCYSWAADPGCLPGIDTVPMIWDETHVDDRIGGCSEWIMGFNEPDHPGQCNLSAQAAVKPWAQVEARAAGRKLVAPVPAYGTSWLIQFRAAFRAAYGRDPRFDALAVHCYYPTAQACMDKARAFIALARQWGIGEVWVTEYHFASESEARAFVALLDAEPLVTRHSPFVSRLDCEAERAYWNCAAAGDPSLFDADWNLTAKGAWYARPAQEGP